MLRWPAPIYIRLGYVFHSRFSAESIQPISMIFDILHEDGATLRKCYYFVVGIKTLKISAYVENRIFTKNVGNFETLRQIYL